MKILSVIPFTKSPVHEDLTYFTSRDVALGNIVEITLRNKKMLGLVVSIEDASNSKGEVKELDFNLKKIIDVKEDSIWRNEYIGAILSTSKYFISKKNIAFNSLIPKILTENYDSISNTVLKNKREDKKNIVSAGIRTEKLLFQAELEDRISFYKTLIRASFAEKKSIFIVLPTEHDVNEFENILSKGIEQFIFSFSSGKSPKKILKQINTMVEMEHPVLVLGTAPYLSIPRYDFGTIILEHESSNAYKMQYTPYFDLRVFVEIFASKINAKLILCDTLLRFETIARKELDDWGDIAPLSYRINQDCKVEIMERITERNKRKFSIFTDENIESIKKAVDNNQNVVIFSLRKGLATMTICRDCNDIVMCDKCSAPLVLYLSRDGKKRMFICNRCSGEKDPETRCATCGSWNLFPHGIGNDGVYEEVKKNFPKTKIFKLDKEEVDSAKGAERIIDEFESNKGAILIGTQMALFYLKEKVPLSIIASFDSLWSIPNFKMGEKIIELIFSIISKTKEKLIVITKNIKDPALLAIEQENLLSFVRGELEDRKLLGYPPYKRFIKITYSGSKEDTATAKKYLAETFQEYEIDIFSGFVAKQKDKYTTNALIKLDPQKWSLPELSTSSSVDERLHTLLLGIQSPFIVSIDPESLL